MKTQKKDLTTAAYEKGIQDYLKEVAESGSDVHENYTPAEICDMMLDKVDLAKAETVLVLYNIELLFALKKRKFSGHVTFFTQSQEKAGLAPKIFSNLTVEYIDKEENPLYHMENKWPDKFDIVIANPPYSNKLDLKFLDKAFDISKDEIVFVHPATAFVERKKSVSIFKDIRDKIKKNLNSLTLFNGNGVFGIGLYIPCSITHITKSKKKSGFYLNNIMDGTTILLEEKDIEDISIFGKSDMFICLEKKINPNESLQTKSIEDRKNRELRIPGSFFVSTSTMQGACKRGDAVKVPVSSKLYNDDFFTVIRKFATTENLGNPNYSIWWEFDTQSEGENFIRYCKTDFARFCIALTKMDQAISGGGMKKVPWMDFTQEWTDKKLYAHFNITEEEQAFIKEVIPPYYD